MNEFEELYVLYENRNFNGIIAKWKKYTGIIGKNAIVKTMGKKFAGKIKDIDKNCNLVLRLNNGKIERIVEGDLFVK